jgi:integrase
MKSVFKFGVDNKLIERPVRFGSEFHKPTKAVLRMHKAASGSKMLDAAQIRKLLDAADVLYRALILLGVNAGYGNGDCAALPLDAVDLDGGWIDFPRPKTAIARRCKLWPETVSALKEWIVVRPAPKDDDAEKLFFLTERGTPLIRDTEKSRTDNITMMSSALTKAAKVHRPGLGFHVLRRVFRTVGDATLDRVACDVVMGHADASMGATYRQGIEDVHLERVAEHVRQWLFGEMRGADVATDEGADSGPREAVQGKNERAHLRVFAGWSQSIGTGTIWIYDAPARILGSHATRPKESMPRWVK